MTFDDCRDGLAVTDRDRSDERPERKGRPLTTDVFVEAFAAGLVGRGRRRFRPDDPTFREGLWRVWTFLAGEVESCHEEKAVRRRALVNLRNLFHPGPVGSFDDFEAILRAKRTWLFERADPLCRDVVIKVPTASVDAVLDGLDAGDRDLVSRAVDAYFVG